MACRTAVKLVQSAKRGARDESDRGLLFTLRPAKPPVLTATPVSLVRTQLRKETLLHYPNMYRCFAFQDSPQMLSYIELCLSKSLNPIDCIDSTAQCDYNKPVLYPPIVRVM